MLKGLMSLGISQKRAEFLVNSNEGKKQIDQDTYEKRRGLVAGVESSTGDPTLTGSKVFKDTGDPLTDALSDIKRGVTVDEASIRHGIPVERLEKLSGVKAARLDVNDMFAKGKPLSEEARLAELKSLGKRVFGIDENLGIVKGMSDADLLKFRKLLFEEAKFRAIIAKDKFIELVNEVARLPKKLVNDMWKEYEEGLAKPAPQVEVKKPVGLSIAENKEYADRVNAVAPERPDVIHWSDARDSVVKAGYDKTEYVFAKANEIHTDPEKATQATEAPKSGQHTRTHWIFIWIGYASFLVSCIVTPQERVHFPDQFERDLAELVGKGTGTSHSVVWEFFDYSNLSYETLVIEWIMIAVLTGVPAFYFYKRNQRKQ